MRGIRARLFVICALIAALVACGLPISSQPPVSATSAARSAPSTGESGGTFTPSAPISDVCSLLTISDIQTVMPGARPGVEQATPPTSDLGFWSRDCKWDVSDTSVQAVELVIFGANTEQGLAGIKAAARSGKTNTSVGGLGSEAHYWVDDSDNGVWAQNGSLSVDVTTYFLTPMPTEGQLHPFVAKVLGEIK
jgi:hypothetical protein